MEKLKYHPMHWQRIKFLIKRMKRGKTEDDIVEEIKTLHWKDFNERVTRYHIKVAKRYL